VPEAQSHAGAVPPRQRVVVVGSGIAGLTAAWCLAPHHDVTLLERQASPGLTAGNVTVPDARGRPVRVDVPLRVFYPGYYPTLVRLLDALALDSEPVSYATTFTGADGDVRFRYRNLRWGDRSWGVVAPQDLWHGRTPWRVLAGLWGFTRALQGSARGPGAVPAGETLGQFVQRECASGRLTPEFVEVFLLPAVCTVCTCTLAQAQALPAAVALDYVARGVTRQAVRRMRHGADALTQALTARAVDLRCGARLAHVVPRADHLRLVFEDDHDELADHVVFATPAPRSRGLQPELGADEAALLSRFATTPVEVLTHDDEALMPRRRSDWSPVHVWLSPGQPAPESTIWVNAVQPALRGAAPVFQTVHPQRAVRAAAHIGHARFERPLVTPDSQAALQALQTLQGQPGRRVWYCGAFAEPGVPLLESAVRSALRVARALGAPGF
jgi:predicted NAD/FAD-binding protein